MTDEPTPQPPDLDLGVNTDAAPGSAQGAIRGTAAAKVANTLRELSQPDPDAGAMELTLASIAMGLEGNLGPQLAATQASGELDEWLEAMTRFLASHRSDSARRLLVVEVPRYPLEQLQPGVRLRLLDEAAAKTIVNPLRS